MRDITRMKIMLKGIVTPEDAELSVQNGIDGILVSKHGGRGEDNGRSTIDALPEIIAAVKRRIPVIVDSGFRRGTDAVKALALGEQAVGIGRPYLWGLGAFGQEGVERVLDIVHTETRVAMQQCGVRSVNGRKSMCFSSSVISPAGPTSERRHRRVVCRPAAMIDDMFRTRSLQRCASCRGDTRCS